MQPEFYPDTAVPATGEAPSSTHPAIYSRLEDVRIRIEAEFLSIGDVLMRAIEGVNVLVAAMDTLVEAMDAETVEATKQNLTGAAAQLCTLPAGQARRQAVATALGEHQVVLSRHLDDMRRALAYMRAFTINIKITGGALAGAESDFACFADEIANGIELCRSEVEGLADGIERLEGKLAFVLAGGDALNLRMQQLLPAISMELTASAEVVADHHRRIAAAAAKAAVVGRDIRKRIARILSALQIGDITRQRIEHVQSGLVELNKAATSLPEEASVRLIALGCVLLRDQLDATAQDWRGEMVQVSQNMADMADAARELIELCDMALGREAGDAGLLGHLEERISQASALVDEVEAADQAGLAAKVETVDAVRTLAARVQTIQAIKTDVQCMALNTALRCTRVGELGRPLSVIAMELRTQGAQLESSAAQGMKVLDQLAAAAAGLSSDQVDGAQEEAETQAAGPALRTGAARIRAAKEQSQAGLVDLASRGAEVVGLLDRCSSQVSDKGGIEADLEHAAVGLAAAACEAEGCTDDIGEALEHFLGVLGAHYTMVQERDVQQAFLEAWGGETTDQTVAAAA